MAETAGDGRFGNLSRDGGGYTDRCNALCQAAAVRGNLEEAQRYAEKLAAAGRDLYITSFNALLRGFTNASDMEAAERWFQKMMHPLLHPELKGLQATAETYNAMVEAFAARQDLPRAESYARDGLDAGMPLSKRSYELLVDACMQLGDPRRAHQWMEAMVEGGHKRLRKATVQQLVLDLTAMGNVRSASKWLTYMSEIGQTLDAGTYAHVKAALPMEVMPCHLSGEYGGELRAAGVVPAKLQGELMSQSATEVRPKREASVVLPPRSPQVLSGSARWPERLAAEVRNEATKRMPPQLKAEFIRAAGGDLYQKAEVKGLPRSPRKRYLSGSHNVQYSRAAPISWPAESKLSDNTLCHPHWLELGPPPQGNPQYGGD